MRKISYVILIPVALLMAIQPIGQQPHLVEKLRMLVAGSLRRPVDIFDLALHGTGLVLLTWKIVSDLSARRTKREQHTPPAP
jgi:hypothetical protein